MQGLTPTRRSTSPPAAGKAGIWMQLHDDRPVYHPDDVIQGSLSVTLLKRSANSCVTVCFEGAIHVCEKNKDPEVGGCITHTFTLISLVHTLQSPNTALEAGTHTWPFSFTVPPAVTTTTIFPLLTKWKGTPYPGLDGERGPTNITLPPSTCLRIDRDGQSCNHCFIEYKLRALGPKIRTNLLFTKPMTAFCPINLAPETMRWLDRPPLDKAHGFIGRFEMHIPPTTDKLGLSSADQSSHLTVAVRFPSEVQLDNPRPFPFVVDLTIRNPAANLIEEMSQIDFTDFHLGLQAHTECLTPNSGVNRNSVTIPLPRYYRPVRHSLEFHFNQNKDLTSSFDAAQLIGLSVPGDQGDRKLWPLQFAENSNENCTPSFTTWIWKRWYELSFNFKLVWDTGSCHVSSGWPCTENYVIEILAPHKSNGSSKKSQVLETQPPSYNSLIDEQLTKLMHQPSLSVDLGTPFQG